MAIGHTTSQKVRVEARRTKVSELYLSGHTIGQIALMLTPEFPTPSGRPILYQSISKDLKAIRQQWRSSAIRNFDDAKAMELAKIDQVEVEAWEAWRRSIGVHTVVTVKTTTVEAVREGEADIPADERIEKSESLAGDPRYLERIQKCVDQRMQLLDLAGPIRVDASMHGPDGGPIETKSDVAGITIVEFARAFAAVATGRADPKSLAGTGPDDNQKPVDTAEPEKQGLPEPQAGPAPDAPHR